MKINWHKFLTPKVLFFLRTKISRFTVWRVVIHRHCISIMLSSESYAWLPYLYNNFWVKWAWLPYLYNNFWVKWLLCKLIFVARLPERFSKTSYCCHGRVTWPLCSWILFSLPLRVSMKPPFFSFTGEVSESADRVWGAREALRVGGTRRNTFVQQPSMVTA